jgi:predicted regulator of Ras-like GTPase activity (Roadblock/LC7/MglB family)
MGRRRRAGRNALQELLKTDEEVDAKAVASHLGGLPGVKGCAIMFADGLSLAGSFPPEYGAEGLCALAPSIMQRVEKHLVETKLGELRTLTLSCAEAAITFLSRDNLCIAVLHPHDKLAADVRKRLPRVLEALSLKYNHPV